MKFLLFHLFLYRLFSFALSFTLNFLSFGKSCKLRLWLICVRISSALKFFRFFYFLSFYWFFLSQLISGIRSLRFLFFFFRFYLAFSAFFDFFLHFFLLGRVLFLFATRGHFHNRGLLVIWSRTLLHLQFCLCLYWFLNTNCRFFLERRFNSGCGFCLGICIILRLLRGRLRRLHYFCCFLK